MAEADPDPENEVGPPGVGVAEMLPLLVCEPVSVSSELSIGISRLSVVLLVAVGVGEEEFVCPRAEWRLIKTSSRILPCVRSRIFVFFFTCLVLYSSGEDLRRG